MIIAIDNVFKIDGNKKEVLSEAIQLMHGIYEIMVEKEGEEAADEQFREMFRLATMSKEEVKAEADEHRKMNAETELLNQEPPRFLS